MQKNRDYISNEELDRLIDEGEQDILQYFDVENARRPGLEDRTVAVDLPERVFDALERESGRTGTPIQDLVQAWIKERAALI
ncbi:MAG: BrnA antitoxin family protein [Bifidobacteriaceae bacterium]|jgi:hypothetical protein|nr:BrnA antitoxin family protein [Bifidobacteriaceae bacterium]